MNVSVSTSSRTHVDTARRVQWAAKHDRKQFEELMKARQPRLAGIFGAPRLIVLFAEIVSTGVVWYVAWKSDRAKRAFLKETMKVYCEEYSKHRVTKKDAIDLCALAALLSDKSYVGGEHVAAALASASLDSASGKLVTANVQHGIAVAGNATTVDAIVKQCKKDANKHLVWTGKKKQQSGSSDAKTKRPDHDIDLKDNGGWLKDNEWWGPDNEVA